MLAYCPDWTNNHKAYGESVTFGEYTFSASLYPNRLNVDSTDLLIGGDAASYTTPQKTDDWNTNGLVYGLNAYIRKANGAVNPVISFQEETPVETTELIENSIAKVDNGQASAHQAAEKLKTIVANVSEVADLVESIAKASKEQSLAIEQINQGVLQVSQVVQANSATSEESASASEELSRQAELLSDEVRKFKI